MKRIMAVALLALAFGCGDRNGPAPSNQDDACAILQQRPGWLEELNRAERNWGVPASVQMAIIWKESSFRQRARPYVESKGSFPSRETRSSAYGYSQAIDGTWEWYQDSTGNRSARRTDFGDATDFIGWYTRESERRSGIAPTDAYNLYLAYHQGHGGYNRGSYWSQQWLLNTARQVRNRELLYRKQLPYCRV